MGGLRPGDHGNAMVKHHPPQSQFSLSVLQRRLPTRLAASLTTRLGIFQYCAEGRARLTRQIRLTPHAKQHNPNSFQYDTEIEKKTVVLNIP